MECSEARSLLDQGVLPNAQTALNSRLGFHLASCAACRAYRTRQQDLLVSLLAEDAAPLHRSAGSARVVRPRGLDRAGLALLLWRLSLALLIGIPLAVIASIAWGAVQVERNLAALTVTPALAVPVAPSPHATADATAFTLPTIMAPLPSAPAAHASPLLDQRPATILLIGTDRRPDEQAIPRADALMLARIDPVRGRIALLSLPRDLWVTIPGYGENRINSAYVWGEYYNAPGGGLGLTRTTVATLLGIPVDYAITIDFTGFAGLVDELGGVMVTVDRELNDPAFPTMDFGLSTAHFVPGRQYMDGATALTYSRIRHPDSDFERLHRQQTVLLAIGERLRDRGELRNLVDAERITAALARFVSTDMPREHILGLVWAMRNFDPAAVERYALAEEDTTSGVGTDQYAIAADSARLAELADMLIAGSR